MFDNWESGVERNERNIVRNVRLNALIASHSKETKQATLRAREFKVILVGDHMVLILM